MPQSQSSFLISVSIILVLALFVPCIESVIRLVRRASLRRESTLQRDRAKTYSSEIA